MTDADYYARCLSTSARDREAVFLKYASARRSTNGWTMERLLDWIRTEDVAPALFVDARDRFEDAENDSYSPGINHQDNDHATGLEANVPQHHF